MRIIFVRHGHPNYAKDCLTELGHKHAAAVAERLKDEGIEEIYSSTCGRAYETAGYVAKECNLPIAKCGFMREISWGSINGEPLFNDGHPWSTVDNMVANGENVWDYDWASKAPFANNKMVGCVENIAIALDKWLETLGYKREGLYYRVMEGIDTHRTIAAFGHGGAGSAILSHLLNLPYPFVCTTFGQDYTGITIVTLSDTPGALVKPSFEIMNDARHIKDLQIENVFGNSECLNCKELQNDMLNAEKDPHSMLIPTYEKLKSMYESNKLKLVISDCSFEHFMQEVAEERHYTYQAYLQCPECKAFFHLGVCVRGTPIYEVTNCPPDMEKFIDIAKQDGKVIYRGKGN